MDNSKIMLTKRGKEIYSKIDKLLDSYERFLSKTPQPSSQEVRDMTLAKDKQWKDFCKSRNLINMDHLFLINVKKLWEAHKQ